MSNFPPIESKHRGELIMGLSGRGNPSGYSAPAQPAAPPISLPSLPVTTVSGLKRRPPQSSDVRPGTPRGSGLTSANIGGIVHLIRKHRHDFRKKAAAAGLSDTEFAGAIKYRPEQFDKKTKGQAKLHSTIRDLFKKRGWEVY